MKIFKETMSWEAFKNVQNLFLNENGLFITADNKTYQLIVNTEGEVEVTPESNNVYVKDTNSLQYEQNQAVEHVAKAKRHKEDIFKRLEEAKKALEAKKKATKALEANKEATEALEAKKEATKALEANKEATEALEHKAEQINEIYKKARATLVKHETRSEELHKLLNTPDEVLKKDNFNTQNCAIIRIESKREHSFWYIGNTPPKYNRKQKIENSTDQHHIFLFHFQKNADGSFRIQIIPEDPKKQANNIKLYNMHIVKGVLYKKESLKLYTITASIYKYNVADQRWENTTRDNFDDGDEAARLTTLSNWLNDNSNVSSGGTRRKIRKSYRHTQKRKSQTHALQN